MSFTVQELAEMAADAEIEAGFSLTQEEIVAARSRDRAAAFDALPPERRKVAAQQRAYYEVNKEKVAAQQRAYREANKERIMADMDRGSRKSRPGPEAKNWVPGKGVSPCWGKDEQGSGATGGL